MNLCVRDNLIGIPRSIWKVPEFTLADNLKFEILYYDLTVIYKPNKKVKKFYKFEFGSHVSSIDYSSVIDNTIVISLTLAEKRPQVIYITPSGQEVYEGRILWPITNNNILIDQDFPMIREYSKSLAIVNGEVIPHPQSSKFITEENYVYIPYFALALIANVPPEFPNHLILDLLNLPEFLPPIRGPYPQGQVNLHFNDKIVSESLENLLKYESEFIDVQLENDGENVYLPAFESNYLGTIRMADYIGSKRLPHLTISYYVSLIFDVPL